MRPGIFSYIVKRFITGFFLLLVYVSILFFLIQLTLPGDFISQNILGLTRDQAMQLRQQLGLDLPLFQRYLNWLSNLLTGNLGISYSTFGSGSPVSEIIKHTLPVTLLIFGLGTGIAFLVGFWLGKYTAWRGPGFLSSGITFISVALYTAFPPWLAFLVLYVLATRLNLPISMNIRTSFSEPGARASNVVAQMALGLVVVLLLLLIFNGLIWRLRRRSLPVPLFLLLVAAGWAGSWFLLDIQQNARIVLRGIFLPTLIYALLSFGEVMLLMRTAMTETLHEDYVQTARAKGLSERKVRDRHAARLALLPVVSRLIISLPFLLSGMVMIERVLNVEGVGTALFFSVGMQNVPLALGILIVIGVIVIVTRLVLDVVQFLLDPRLRASSGV